MKSPTGEPLHLCAEANAEHQPSGFTGGLDLYDELIDFLGPSPEPQTAVDHSETPCAITTPPASTFDVVIEPPAPASPPVVVAREATVPVADSGALPQSGDVIKITGPLNGFAVAKRAGSAIVVCADCGQSSNSDELFCIHCGGLLEQMAVSAETAFTLAALCEDCGAMVENDEIFCPACGAVMTTA